MVTTASCLGGCGSSPGAQADMTTRPGLSFHQAKGRVAQLVQQSLTHVAPAATLRPIVVNNTIPCSDNDGAPPSTPVSISSDYWIEGLGEADVGHVVTAFVDHWTSRGWSVRRDDRPGSYDVVLQEDDGFQVEISSPPNSVRISLGSSSPCVEPAAP